MGDVSHSQKDLESTEYRKNTYRDCYLPTGFNIASLAEVGFYFTRRGNIVKCFKCSIEVDLSNTDAKTNLIVLHKRLNSECQFAKELIELPAVPSQQRSKTFLSYDSLRYECERLETFIDWPVAFLMPADLAADGFYYLRTADHCACVFCRGIVGAWEEGDTPRGEHERHFSHCPFIRGQPVGNVPISQSNILSKLPPGASAQPQQPCIVPLNKGLDEVGSRHMPGSYPECMGPQMNEINLEDMGLPQYSGPKRKDFLTKDSRLESFNKWPERVTQKPVDLAESGFFYCGLSDHVRCFHCGNGLRNWEAEDCPWKEHARWYPDCNYILLKKGQEFVDTVRREKPPYKRSQNNEESLNGNKVTTNQPSTSSTPARPSITDAELDRLMELDIPRAVLGMGFPQRTVRATLKQKLEQTGLPFFSLEPCIEAVLQFMEDETRQTLNEAVPELEDEATQEQEAKLQNISSRSNAVGAQATSSGPSASTSTSEISVTISGESEEGAAGLSDPSTNERVAVPQHLPEDELPQASSNIDVPPSLPSVSTSVPTITSIPEGEDIPPVPRGPVPKPRILSQPSPIVPISPTPVSEPVPHPTIPTQEHPVATVASSVPSVPSVPQEMSNIQISEMESSETPVEDEPMDVDEDDTSQPVPSTSTNITHTPPLDRVISQADEVMTVAEAILKVPASGPPSLEKTEESSSSSSSSSSSTSQESKERQRENVENPVTPVGSTATGISKSLPQQSSQNLAEELEKIRDMRTCKVCMDAEMDVVFLPCAHMVTCSSCAATLAQCPICRANIRYTIKPIVS
ncbi:unnamed protein product, partial [Meganyctiphanes norvegica]